MKLLLVKSERWEKSGKRYDPALVIVPDGYDPQVALNDTVLHLPDAYVVAEYDLSAVNPLDLRKLREYASYAEND